MELIGSCYFLSEWAFRKGVTHFADGAILDGYWIGVCHGVNYLSKDIKCIAGDIDCGNQVASLAILAAANSSSSSSDPAIIAAASILIPSGS